MTGRETEWEIDGQELIGLVRNPPPKLKALKYLLPGLWYTVLEPGQARA